MASTTPCAPTEKTALRQVKPAYLHTGYQLKSDLVDNHGRTLGAAGSIIDEALVRRLEGREDTSFFVSARDWENMCSLQRAESRREPPTPKPPRAAAARATEQLDTVLDRGGVTKILADAKPFASQVKQHGATAYKTELVQRLSTQHEESIGQVTELIQDLSRAAKIAGEQIARISHESVMQAAEDMDLFVSLGIRPENRNSLPSHSVSVAKLAIAMGAQLGFSAERLKELGGGCLVHDAGLLSLDPKLLAAGRRLSPSEFKLMSQHPIIATDLLNRNADRVPLGVRMVVYQMHERCDGSGYPHGATGDRIHALARVAMVADSFVEMISARPHRAAIPPHTAIKYVLEGVRLGKFDALAVRALLRAVSLFPIGSFVELSDGRVGKVLRAGGEDYESPLLRAWSVGQPETTALIDLQRRSMSVVRALDTPPAAVPLIP